ncbi:MAG: bacillithiol biosynthesis deacetylase BshB1 [Bacteroidota bacterium]|nr:bacillithiol biosynthesis deacetylase BshB1 [Bacteroidota bacterium]
MFKLSILAVAAHPDDVELSCAGTLIKHAQLGYKTGILDLTQGELGTKGTPAIRKKEADAASKIMGISYRENLGLADGFFENDKTHLIEIVKIIRHCSPEIMFINAPQDRHPDHGNAAELTKRACFLAGLVKIETSYMGAIQKPWRPKQIFHYVQDTLLPVDFVIDITQQFELKMDAIKAFGSQFYNPNSNEPKTYISDEKYFAYIQARATEFGHSISTLYGEGFIKTRQIGLENIFNLI